MELPPAGRLVPLTPALISSVVRNFASPAPVAASPPPISPPSFIFSDQPPVPEEEFSLELLVRCPSCIIAHLSSIAQGAAAASAPIPDLSKELRNTNFPIVHLLLRTSLQEFVSTKAPQFADLNDRSDGWMYLYDGKVENYKDDVIKWVHRALLCSVLNLLAAEQQDERQVGGAQQGRWDVQVEEQKGGG